MDEFVFQEAKAKLKLWLQSSWRVFFVVDCINNTLAWIWLYSPSALTIFHRQVISSRNKKNTKGLPTAFIGSSFLTYLCAHAPMLLSNERASGRISNLPGNNNILISDWLVVGWHLTLYNSRQPWTRQRTDLCIPSSINCIYSGTRHPLSVWEIQGVAWERVNWWNAWLESPV